MASWRKRAITAIVVLFFAGHLSYYVTRDQHWPMLGYPMYSYIVGEQTSDRVVFGCPVMYGVPKDPAAAEFRIKGPMAGMDHANQFAFRKMMEYPYRSGAYDDAVKSCPDGEARRACAVEHLVKAALANVYERYEKRRAGRPKPPPLRGVKLYQVRYQIMLGENKVTEIDRAPLYDWEVQP